MERWGAGRGPEGGSRSLAGSAGQAGSRPLVVLRPEEFRRSFRDASVHFHGHDGSLPQRESTRKRKERRREVAQVRLMANEGRFQGISRTGQQGAEGQKVEAGGDFLRGNNGALVFQALGEDFGGLDRTEQGACEDDVRGGARLPDPSGDLAEGEPALRGQVAGRVRSRRRPLDRLRVADKIQFHGLPLPLLSLLSVLLLFPFPLLPPLFPLSLLCCLRSH